MAVIGSGTLTTRVGDPDVLLRARAGDGMAFGTLMEPLLDRLHRRALAILRDEADALDATQECLLRAWRSLPSLRQAERLEPWLDRILVNSCRDVLRRRGAR